MRSDGEQLLEALGRVVGDAGQHVSEPSLRFDLVELGRHDQRRNGGSAIGATLGAGEEPDAPVVARSYFIRVSKSVRTCIDAPPSLDN